MDQNVSPGSDGIPRPVRVPATGEAEPGSERSSNAIASTERATAERRGVARDVVVGGVERAVPPYLGLTFLQTIWRYLTDHPAFADEVIREDWRRKTKPLPFVIVCFSAAFAAAASADKLKPVMAEDVLEERPQLRAKIQEMLPPDALGNTLTASELAKKLREKDEGVLAEAVEKVPHKSNGLPPWAGYAVLLYFVPQWRLIHRFLKAPHRTPRQTAHLFMYSTGVFYLLGSAIVFAMAFPRLEQAVNVAAAPLLLVLTWRWLRIIKHTHGAGFWRMVGAGIKVNLVMLVMLVPVVLVAALVASIAGGG